MAAAVNAANMMAAAGKARNAKGKENKKLQRPEDVDKPAIGANGLKKSPDKKSIVRKKADQASSVKKLVSFQNQLKNSKSLFGE